MCNANRTISLRCQSNFHLKKKKTKEKKETLLATPFDIERRNNTMSLLLTFYPALDEKNFSLVQIESICKRQFHCSSNGIICL